ncbi:MAG: four helix bundle protein [Gemmatimonadales bacterium]
MDKYRSLVAWQYAHQALLLGLPLCEEARTHVRSWLIDQLGRALVSIEANIVEGYALGSTAQFKRHLVIARGSGSEAETLLRGAVELTWVDAGRAAAVLQALDRTLGAIHGLIRKLSN